MRTINLKWHGVVPTEMYQYGNLLPYNISFITVTLTMYKHLEHGKV